MLSIINIVAVYVTVFFVQGKATSENYHTKYTTGLVTCW